MTERDRRRAHRDQLRDAPPDAGILAFRHRVTGRVVVVGTENLAGLRNRFEFAQATGLAGALPDPHLVADAKAHGLDAVELEVLETVPVEPGTEARALRSDLDTLAELWRERLASGG